MSLGDLDANFIKSISTLHSYNHVMYRGEPSYIQITLEEAIKNKTGHVKDFSELVAVSQVDNQFDEYEQLTCTVEDYKESSDNELELDLLKEDLMCIVCNGMDVGARNRLLECSDCHYLYHQECHRPVVTTQDADNTWVCQNCKESKQKQSPVDRGLMIMTAAVPTSPKIPATKSSPIHFNKPSTKPIISTTSSRTPITPNINIISADKRVQIMRKKAAKQQEKRKLSR